MGALQNIGILSLGTVVATFRRPQNLENPLEKDPLHSFCSGFFFCANGVLPQKKDASLEIREASKNANYR